MARAFSNAASAVFAYELPLWPCSLFVEDEHICCLVEVRGRGDVHPVVYKVEWPAAVRLLLQWDGDGAALGTGIDSVVGGGECERFALLLDAAQPPSLSRLDAGSR